MAGYYTYFMQVFIKNAREEYLLIDVETEMEHAKLYGKVRQILAPEVSGFRLFRSSGLIDQSEATAKLAIRPHDVFRVTGEKEILVNFKPMLMKSLESSQVGEEDKKGKTFSLPPSGIQKSEASLENVNLAEAFKRALKKEGGTNQAGQNRPSQVNGQSTLRRLLRTNKSIQLIKKLHSINSDPSESAQTLLVVRAANPALNNLLSQNQQEFQQWMLAPFTDPEPTQDLAAIARIEGLGLGVQRAILCATYILSNHDENATIEHLLQLAQNQT